MSWWKQVRCELAPHQQQLRTTAVCNNSSSNGVLADMNGTNGNCSCHKQRRCNRLTCYRNGNSSGSNHPRALPLFITVAILALAMTPINAAVMKRSIAETSTNLNSTTPNSPPATIDENDSTTANTPLLANNQSTVGKIQHNVAMAATVVNEPEITTVGSSTVPHDDQVITLGAPQDVNNEIAQVVSEEAATDFQVRTNPKFDYTETVLDENLEDSIRNSVRNEIEFEQDIVAGEVPHLELLTDEELRQRLATEVLLIQRSFQEGGNRSNAAVEALAQLKSLIEKLSTTESTAFERSKTVNNDLSVLFPLQTQETVTPSKSFADNQQDIGAADVQHLEKLTDEALRQRLANEVLLIQRSFQEGGNKSSAAVEAVAELKSLLEQLSTNESTTYEPSKTVHKDLPVLFPLQTEETVSLSKSFADNQRGARNLNIIGDENEEILNDNSETNVHFNEDNGMQNIEEEKIKAQDESLDADKSLLQTFSRISESALYSHEANDIDAEGSALQKGSLGVQEHEIKEEETNFEDKNISAATEKHLVSSEENNLSNEGVHPSVVASAESHETTLSSASNEIVVGTEDQPTVQDEIPNETEMSSAVTDEASLSIVLDENITATEATTALAEDLPLDLLHLDESDALAAAEAPTTAEPESVKSVHSVIKKQGVELDEDLFVPAPAEPVEETTASIDIVNEEMFEDEKATAKPTESLVNDVDSEKEQTVQNDDAENETSLQLDDEVAEPTVSESIGAITGQVIEENPQTNNEGDKLSEDTNQIDAESVEGSGQEDQDGDSNPTISDESTQFDEKHDALNDNKYLEEINNDIASETEKSIATENVQSANVEAPTEDILQEAEEDNEITQVSSTTESMTAQESEDNENNSLSSSTTERSGQMHISLLSTTDLPSAEVSHTPTNTIERQSTTPKEFEVIDDDDNNTDDPGIVPLLVGVSAGQGDVTASTKGSRSINTQTHHTMLLTQLDDTMAATLFETFPPHNAGRTLNDHMAAESSGGIGKPLPTRSINQATSASIFSRSGLIIVVCSSIAFMFLLVSVAAFLISFHRQHGTLDIEMQEQRCGKDDLDEEDEEAGTCTKLLEIELPKSTIVTASCEELEECL